MTKRERLMVLEERAEVIQIKEVLPMLLNDLKLRADRIQTLEERLEILQSPSLRLIGGG